VHRGYYHRKSDPAEAETLRRREEGLASRVAGLLSLLGLIAAAVYIFYPAWMAWAALPLPAWLRWTGIGIALAGFALLQWAQTTLGKNWSSTPRLLKNQALVTSGPYRLMRHPIYTAFLLIMSATLFLSANWFVGLAWIGMVTLDGISRIRIEEAMMMEAFGDEYRAYMRRTGRFLPRLSRSS
jgi:protein-S-isoprenylcysteine O-methyltransferase Ste14